jgi:uncharacterized RDD family membrane protein YckC
MELPQIEYAGFWRRFFAYIIDSFFNYIVFFFGSLELLVLINNHIIKMDISLINALSYVIAIPLSFTFTILCWMNWGRTLGKFIFMMRIVDKDGNKLDLEKSVIRCFGYLLSTICILLGFLWIAFDKKKQGWHDKLAKSFVVTT